MLCSDEICLISEYLDHPKDIVNLLFVNKQWNSIKEEEIYLKSFVLRVSESKIFKNTKFMKNISKKSENFNWEQKYNLLTRIFKEQEFINSTNQILSNENLIFGEKWKIIIKNLKLFKNFKFIQNFHLGNRESLLDVFFKSLFFIKFEIQEAFDYFKEIYTLTGLKLLSKHGVDYPYINLVRTKQTELISKIKIHCVKEFQSLESKDAEKMDILIHSIQSDDFFQFKLMKRILDRYQSKLYKINFLQQYKSLRLTQLTMKSFVELNYDLEVWRGLFSVIQPKSQEFWIEYNVTPLLASNSNPLEKLEILIDLYGLKKITNLGYCVLKYFKEFDLKIVKLLISKTFYFEQIHERTLDDILDMIGFYPTNTVEFLFQNGFLAKMNDLVSVMKFKKIHDSIGKVKLFLKYDKNLKVEQLNSIPTKYLSQEELEEFKDLVEKFEN
jgi:hypothetical protein